MTSQRRLAGSVALLALVLLALAMLAPRAARAQGTASQAMNGVAFLDVASAVAGLRNLGFGTVTPGVVSTVAAAPAAGAACVGCQSGMVTYTNLSKRGADKFLVVTFPGLPTTLAGPSGSSLAVSFQAAGCLLDQQTGAEYYCAAAAAVTAAGNYRMQINGPAPAGGSNFRNANIYIGGSVTPTTGQRPGVYAGTVSLVFSYSSV